jgi:antitoxin ParD1/3/4
MTKITFFQSNFDKDKKTVALKKAIQEGLASGIIHDFDPKEHLKQLKSKRK